MYSGSAPVVSCVTSVLVTSVVSDISEVTEVVSFITEVDEGTDDVVISGRVFSVVREVPCAVVSFICPSRQAHTASVRIRMRMKSVTAFKYL